MTKSKVLITGSSGFVGRNLIHYFDDEYSIVRQRRDESINLDVNCFIHLAGKAHDLRNNSSIDDYYEANVNYTKTIYDAFISSNAAVFIFISSVKAVADNLENKLTEEHIASPITDYGKSKLLAENYILSNIAPIGKRVYILRPCMIHGPGNKGNLNLLYSLVSKGLPWPLGLFENTRSYLSIENLCFVIKELIERADILSGVYNMADDIPLSTNDVIKMIAESKGKKVMILNFSKNLIKILARVGDLLKLPLNSERLQKLTESYVVSNVKIKSALGEQLPISSKEGLIKTFISFANNA